MVKTKFLVLSDDPIKRYELIFKPSLKSYSWNLMIFEVFIVDLIGLSNDIEDPNIFIPKDASWWDLSHSREKNEIFIEKSSLITILPLFFMTKIRFFWVKFACFYHEKISRQSPPKILFIPKDSPWKTASFGRWTTEKKTCPVNRIFHYKETYYNTFSIISDFYGFFMNLMNSCGYIV